MTPDEPPEVQAVVRLLHEHIVIICSTCGAADARTTDGRRRHQMLHGHPLSGTETETRETHV